MKTITDLAIEVLAGKWGAGADRKTKLTNAGYSYAQVQAAVNSIIRNKEIIMNALGCTTVPKGNILNIDVDLDKYDGICLNFEVN